MKLFRILATVACLASSATAQDAIIHHTIDYLAAWNAPNPVGDAVSAALKEAVTQVLGPANTPEQRMLLDQTIRELDARKESVVRYQVMYGPTQRPGGMVGVGLRVEIDRAVMQAARDRVKRSLQSRPRYSIMIVIDCNEHRHEAAPLAPVIPEMRRESVLTEHLTRTLADMNYKLIDGRRFAQLRGIRLDEARIHNDDASTVWDIATAQGADIVLSGWALADGPRQKTIEGRLYWQWHCTAGVTAYWAATGDVIGAVPLPIGGWDDASEVMNGAANGVFAKAGRGIGEALVQLLSDLPNRTPELSLTIKDCDFESFGKLSDWVPSFTRASARNPQFRGGTYTDALQASVSSKDLAEALLKWEDPRLKIEIEECTLHVVKARLVPR